jgi:glutamate synthase (NADPH/NADH) small chain
MELGDPDEKGRRKPVPTGRFKDLECDTVIYALGTKANPIITGATPGLGLNKWGNVVADDQAQATTLPGVFAGGDIVTGGATVILAMGAGRRAAKGIATWLSAGKSKWPVTPDDLAAFVPMKPIAAGAAAAASSGKGASHVDTGAKLCPKCKQPLDGDEEYICCANSKLQWRCESCAKVSEGFAFPYGQCPACGGKLAPTGERNLADAQAMDAIRTAFEIELGGMAFYKRAAAESTDPMLKELFGKFAEMEKEHMATLSARYHADVSEASQGFKTERAAVYAGIPNNPSDPANLFRIAIAFEQRAVKFFGEKAEQTPEGSVERQLYKELAAEEREHVDILVTEFNRFKAGKPGLL